MSISDDGKKRRIAIILFIAGGAALAGALIFFNVMKNDASTYRKMIMKATDKTPAQLDPEPAPTEVIRSADSDNAGFSDWSASVVSAFAENAKDTALQPGTGTGGFSEELVAKAGEWKTSLDSFTYEELSQKQQKLYDLIAHFLKNAGAEKGGDKEKYAAVLEQKLGAEKNILAYEEMLDAYIEQIFSDSDRIMKDNKSVKNALKKFTFPEGGYEEQLAYITERAGDIYCGVKPSDVVLEETQERFHDDERYSFSKPAGEGSGADVFVLNKAVADERKDLFTAVARDIFPGTMALEARKNADRAEAYLTPSGVRDGAASFAEFSAYDLLDGEDRSVIDLKRNNSRSILLLCGKADLMANYYGKTKDEVNNFLTGYGVSDEAARSRIFNHINEVPGDYAARALGYVHILEMQRKAKDLKGEAYSDKAFYAFLTNYGDLPFKAMEKRLYLM